MRTFEKLSTATPPIRPDGAVRDIVEQARISFCVSVNSFLKRLTIAKQESFNSLPHTDDDDDEFVVDCLLPLLLVGSSIDAVVSGFHLA